MTCNVPAFMDLTPSRPYSSSGNWSPVQLSLRLKSICDREGLRINARVFVDLFEVMDSDVRGRPSMLCNSCTRRRFVNCQISANRELTCLLRTPSNRPWKFTMPSSTIQPQIIPSEARVLTIWPSSSGRKYSELLEMIWEVALKRINWWMDALEIYPSIKFFDNTTMDRVNGALELFSSFDLMDSSAASSSGRLDGYLAYKLCGLKGLFSSPFTLPSNISKKILKISSWIRNSKQFSRIIYRVSLPKSDLNVVHVIHSLTERILQFWILPCPNSQISNHQILSWWDRKTSENYKSVEILSKWRA